MHRCYDCKKPWISPGTLESWYSEFAWWASEGRCPQARSGIDPFKKTLHPLQFALCLQYWYENDSMGRTFGEEFRIDFGNKKMLGYLFYANALELQGYDSEGVAFVDDMNRIAQQYGPPKSVANNREFIEIDQYRVFFDELFEGTMLSTLAIVVVVGFITVNWQI